MSRHSVNFDATLIDAVVAATETTVAHQLGRTPQEVFVVTKSASANIYRGATAWDETNIYIQASAATSARLLIF